MSDLPPLEGIVPRVVELCQQAAEGYAFRTYWVGVRVKRRPDLDEADLSAWKGQLKLAVGKDLGDRWASEGREAEFLAPQMLLTYDLAGDRVERQVRSAFIYGRYRKLARGLPQTRAFWRCPECKGKGCETCLDTGRRFPITVEDLLGREVDKAFRARGYRLHGLGREDIDVRCLGNGRPFVLELKKPKRREVDLEALARLVEESAGGRVELPVGFRPAEESLVARLKGWEANKVYRAVCELTGEGDRLDPEAVRGLQQRLEGTVLEQRTPVRVSRRRADKVRRREVLRFVPSQISERGFEAQVEAQSGTYIKELISGDDGRTTPSVAGLLDLPCVCAQLDVLDILVEDEQLFAG